MNFTKEMIEKAKTAKSAGELAKAANSEGIKLSAEKAEKLFADIHKSGELSDEELDNVSGGIRCNSEPSPGGEVELEKDVVFLYKIGQQVEVYYIGNSTERATVIGQYTYKTNNGHYCPGYEVKYSDGTVKKVRQAGIENP